MKLTAEIGAVRRKSWHLREAVTVIGSSPHATVEIHHDHVSDRHCVVVNTGTQILVRNLDASVGTGVNEERIIAQRVYDGDVLRLGAVMVRVAVNGGRESDNAAGSCADPLRMPIQLTLRDAVSGVSWPINNAVAVVGRGAGSDVCLDWPEFSPAHALIAWVDHAPWIFDLGHMPGTRVNGNTATFAPLGAGDRLAWGSLEMAVEITDPKRRAETADSPLDLSGALSAAASDEQTLELVELLESKIAALQVDIAEQYKQLSEWHASLTNEQAEAAQRTETIQQQAEAMAERETDLATRGEQLEARAAEIDQATRALESERARLEKERQSLDETTRSLEQREAKLKAERESLSQQQQAAAATLSDAQATEQKLAATSDALDRREKDLTRRESEIAAERERLDALKANVAAQEDSLAKRKSGLDARESALGEQEQTFQSRQAEIEKADQELTSLQEKLAGLDAEIAQREKGLAEREAAVAAQSADLDRRESEQAEQQQTMEALSAELEQREADVARRQQTIQENEAKVTTLQAELDQRSETVRTDEERIEASRAKLEALRQDLEHRSTGLNEHERALVEREKSVATQRQAQQVFRGLIETAAHGFEKPLEIPKDKTKGGAAAAKAGESPATASSSSGQAPIPKVIGGEEIDDDTRERMRLLRRMGNEHKSDEELLAQVRAQMQSSGPSEPEKRGWWSRKK